MIDKDTATYLAGAALAALSTAVGWVRHDTNARIKRIEEDVKTKADESELTRQRDNIAELFNRVGDVRANMVTRGEFGELRNLIIERLPPRG
jgi:hypothetical protein